MKFNWGTGIFLFYTFFAASLFFMVWKSTRYDHSLVVDNYYEQDLDYQTVYDKKMNSNGLAVGLEVGLVTETNMIRIAFPEDLTQVKGTLVLYRADDKTKDLNFSIETDPANIMQIPAGALVRGHWKVVVDWEANGRGYYDEKVITI